MATAGTYIIPVSQVTPADVTRLRARAISGGEDLVRGSTQTQRILYRALLPTDVMTGVGAVTPTGRLNNPNALVANTRAVNQFPSWQLQNYQATAILGYAAMSPTPLIDEIDFTLGGVQTLAQIFLDEIYVYPQLAGYFNDPVFYGPGETVGVNLLAGGAVAQNAEQFALFGYIFEPYGKTIQVRTLESMLGRASA